MFALPDSWTPYLELTRISKPTGIINIYLPYLLGALLSGLVMDPPAVHLIYVTTMLFLSAVCIRSAGCTWNDIVDRDVDKLVSRTRLRPLARGAISPRRALIFAFAQYVAFFTCLGLVLPDHWAYTVPKLTLVTIYPFAKRYTSYAQVCLGCTLACGVLIGCRSVGVVPMYDQRFPSDVHAAIGALFVSYVIWSTIHDTIYALQDQKDDKRLGLGSMAVSYYGNVKVLLSLLGVLLVSFIMLVGVMIHASGAYQAVAGGGTALLMAFMLTRLDVHNAKDCASWFVRGSNLFGIIFTCGFLVEYSWRTNLLIAT